MLSAAAAGRVSAAVLFQGITSDRHAGRTPAGHASSQIAFSGYLLGSPYPIIGQFLTLLSREVVRNKTSLG